MRQLLILVLLLSVGCDKKANPAAVEQHVRSWAHDGIKGGVELTAVQCMPQPNEAWRCKAAVDGGGEVLVDVTPAADGSWQVDKDPIVVSALVEELLDKRLVELGFEGYKAECGQRVYPAKPGFNFQCAVEDSLGKVHNAADVTVKDAAGRFESNWVTAIVSSAKVEANIVAWLAEQQISGKVDCGQRHRFTAPDKTFSCSVEGSDRKVVATMTDFRGNVTLAFEPEP